MNSSEIRTGEQILRVARDRTSQNYTPYLVDDQLPRMFVAGLRGGVAEMRPSVAAYGLMIDAAFQSATNNTSRRGGIVSDSPSSLDELVRLLKSCGEMINGGLSSNTEKGTIIEAFIFTSEHRQVPLEYRGWFQQASESGIKRVSRFAHDLRESDTRLSNLFRRF